jgi:hypothetical protein
MNGTALHHTTGIMSWIEHEEAVLLRLAKTVQLNFDRIIIPILGIGLAYWVVAMFVTVFVRYHECAKMIALCSR